MQAEVIRIIEGGLSGDKTKVFNYAETLAKNMEREGDEKFARKIQSVLKSKHNGFVTLDSLSAKPVDQESRLEMVDVERVEKGTVDLVLSPFLQKEIDDFVALYGKRDELVKLGLDSMNTLLLYGPPGCGKTSLARYIAAEAKLPLVTARLDGLVSSLLGSTAKNIRRIFDFAAKQECVLFLDEFDVVAKKRDDANELGELKRVVNSLLQNIDGFDGILITATNHQDLLDPAVWRRFSKVLEIPLPQLRETSAYAEKYIEPFMCESLNDKYLLALEGLSFSDLNTLVRNALCSAIVRGEDGFDAIDLLRESYSRQHHMVDDEGFVTYLLKAGVSIRKINAHTGLSIRKIQTMSKALKELGSR